MFYMDDVNDADQEEDEEPVSREEGQEGVEPVPVSSAGTAVLPRNFSLGKSRHQSLAISFLSLPTTVFLWDCVARFLDF